MAKKVLFINQEIAPYVPETALSIMGRDLPTKMQEEGFEIRTFMPKWGNINERRGQLHEVIRLSGMNLVIDDTDHPLIIKVASIPQTRLQVYFIDNDDYFMKRKMALDENGEEYDDNGERAIFFARGVLENCKEAQMVVRNNTLSGLDVIYRTTFRQSCIQRRTDLHRHQNCYINIQGWFV